MLIILRTHDVIVVVVVVVVGRSSQCQQLPGEWRYYVVLQLRDDTASLDAILCGEVCLPIVWFSS